MRIAYIAPYQGPGLLKRRPSLRNLALAGNVKIELIAELLQRSTHNVEILSQGEVVERRFTFYRAFCEPKLFRANIPVFYASALPLRFVNGLWSSLRTLALFKRRHRQAPFDLVVIYNLKLPQMMCASYAMRHLGLPVVLEYEDDALVDIAGESEKGWISSYYSRWARQVLHLVSGCIGVSPHILSRLPPGIPQFLLRGVVTDDIINSNKQSGAGNRNWVVYSGTLYRSKGLEPLITAWKQMDLRNWELRIAGDGELTATLEKLAENCRTIKFHGLLNRQENARFLAQATIGVNPHELSKTPGNVFAFKIIEYLAAGLHVITTPMGSLESELESGITYMPDNTPETIAATLRRVIENREYERTATQVAQDMYGPDAVARSLDKLLSAVMAKSPRKSKSNRAVTSSDSIDK